MPSYEEELQRLTTELDRCRRDQTRKVLEWVDHNYSVPDPCNVPPDMMTMEVFIEDWNRDHPEEKI